MQMQLTDSYLELSAMKIFKQVNTLKYYFTVIKIDSVYQISDRLDGWKGVKFQFPNLTNKQIGQTK